MKKRILAYSVIFLALFVSIAFAYDFLRPLNTAVRSFVAANLWEPFYPVAIFLHNFFETVFGSLQTLVWVVVILFIYKNRSGALLFALAMLVQSASVNFLKVLTAIPRPPQEFFGVFHHNFSYPSGHTSTAVTFAIMLAYIIGFRLGRREGWFIAAAYAVTALVTGYSRMYLDVHWILDIAGGVFFAGFISMLFIALDPIPKDRSTKADNLIK